MIRAADAASLGLAINVVDDRGARLAFLNRAGARILGRSRREQTGGPPVPWATEELVDRFRTAREEGSDAGRSGTVFTSAVERPDGSEVVIEAGIGPGRYRGWPATFVFFWDVTLLHQRREALRETEERHRSVVGAADRAQLGLCIVVEEPDDSRVAFVNDTCARLIGHAPDEIMGEGLGRFVDDERIRPLEDPGQDEGEPTRFEVEVARPDGSSVLLEVGTARGTYEGQPAIFAFLRDVTQQRASERELEALNQRLTASNEDLERFAHAVSHDLREPLRMVGAYAQLIDERYADQLPDEAVELFEFVQEGAERMQRMMAALLEYSRVQTSGEKPAPTGSLPALQDALSSLKLRLDEAGVDVTHDELPTVQADPDQLGRLFQNLVANALDHGGPDLTRVHVSAGAGASGDTWRFTVEDDGRGVEEADREKIFEVFQRGLDPGSEAGVGLGLALCQRIVDRHGGEIGVEGEPGEGARFWFTLPNG